MPRLALIAFAALALPAALPARLTFRDPAVFAAPGARTQQGDRIARTYDLSALAPRSHVEAFVDRITPLLTEFEDRTTELDSEAPADAIASLVLLALESEFDAPGRELRIEAPARLRVVAPAAVHAQVVRVLSFVEASFRRAVDVRFDFVELPADAPIRGGIVSAAEAERLLSSGARRSYSLRVPTGRVGIVDATQQRRYIAGYEVEIGESSAQHYPRMETLTSGVRCAARAAAVPGGVQLALFSSDVAPGALRTSKFAIGALLDGEKGPQEHAADVELELPTLIAQRGGFNLFLPDGQALVFDTSVSLQSGSRRESLVVRCSPSGAPPAFRLELPSGARLEAFDATWSLPPRADFVGFESGFEFVGDASRLESSDDASSIDVSLEPPVLTDVHERLAERLNELSTVGPWILALQRADKPQRDLDFASAELAPTETPGAAQVSWTLRRGETGVVLAAGSIALSLGATSAWMVGAETALLARSDVEIANGTASIGPRVASALDGLVIWARPSRAMDGGLTCAIAVASQILVGAPEETAVGSPLRSVVDRAAWDVLNVHETLYIPANSPAGKFVFHGGGGLELELQVH